MQARGRHALDASSSHNVAAVILIEAIRRVGLVGAEIGIMDVKRRAIGTDDLIVRAHIEVNMRMIGRGPSAHALKFLHADMNFLHTDIVAEMGHAV